MPTSTKRQFLMLSHTLEFDDTRNICGWFLSEKLDGLRVFYDGGITRGLRVRDVPFSNWERDDRYVNIDTNYRCTGLWSRNAKVIQAPSWFLDKLPPMMLDGEIWAGRGNWEITSSIVKKIVPSESDWRQIRFNVFESPAFDQIFEDGEIDTDIYYKHYVNVLAWCKERAAKLGVPTEPENRQFEFLYGWLKRQRFWNDYLHLLPQQQLPYNGPKCWEIINQRMDEVVDQKGEGLMIRNGCSYWSPERTWNLLKIKKWYDSEAIVVGYSWGKKTNKGSKHLGRMGALLVEWNGETFEISGFSDREREIRFTSGGLADMIGKLNPGGRVPDDLWNPTFPRGSKVTFRYRDLTARGIPKNGNYYRKAINL